MLRDDNALLRLSHFDDDGKCDGRGEAVILDEEHSIAVMLGPCGDPNVTRIDAGAIVKFVRHPEAESKIVGTPAYGVPKTLGGSRV